MIKEVWSNMSKIHKFRFRPFPTTVGMVNHMCKKLHKSNEQILGTFVHKNLDFFQTTAGIVKHVKKYTNLDFFQPLHRYDHSGKNNKFRPVQKTVGYGLTI